jgi:hypothetical protein
MYYSLEDYNRILFDGFSYILPETILGVIDKLNTEITENAPINAVITPTFDKNKKPFNNTGGNVIKKQKMNNFNKKHVTNDDWSTLRSFKSTVIEKKEGLEKTINDIRICLNKISAKNYDAQKEMILEQMNVIVESDLEKVAVSIFDIASNNKFYSEIYAELYKELLQKFPVFNKVFDEFITNYKESIKKIHYVNETEDFDKFCEYNKLNDKRKAISTFLVNLLKKDVIEKSLLLDIIAELQDLITTYIEEPNKNNEVDEITENVFILVTMSQSVLKTEKEWKNIESRIKHMTELKAKEKKSLSSRAIFKYMDIVDTLNK